MNGFRIGFIFMVLYPNGTFILEIKAANQLKLITPPAPLILRGEHEIAQLLDYRIQMSPMQHLRVPPLCVRGGQEGLRFSTYNLQFQTVKNTIHIA